VKCPKPVSHKVPQEKVYALKEVAHAVLALKLKIHGAPIMLGTPIVTLLAMAQHISRRPAANRCVDQLQLVVTCPRQRPPPSQGVNCPSQGVKLPAVEMYARKEVAHAALASKLKIHGAPIMLGTPIVTPLALAQHISRHPAANQCVLEAIRAKMD